MASGDISDTQIITSSGSGKARLGVDSWQPTASDLSPFVKVEFPTAHEITAILVKGAGNQFYQSLAIYYTIGGVTAPLYTSAGQQVRFFLAMF